MTNRLSRFLSRRNIVIGGALLLLGFALMPHTAPTNRAQTGADADEAALHPRTCRADIADVRAFLLQNVPTLRTYGRSWRMASHDENSLQCEVPVLFFTDDLKITLQVLAQNQTQVDVVSASRIGQGDFGENRRHILQVLALLDKRFNR